MKIGTQNREISQVLSQVLEYFFCRLYVGVLQASLVPGSFGLELSDLLTGQQRFHKKG